MNFDVKVVNFDLQIYNLKWINYLKVFNFDVKVINSKLKMINYI